MSTLENPTATATGATSATRSAAVRIVLTAPNGSSKSMMTTLRFDGQTAVSDLLGLLAEQEGLTAEEAAEYVIRTPDAILSPDVHLKALVMPSLVYLEHLPRTQRIKLSTQEGNGVSKFLTLDAVVPVSQLLGTIASEFGLKEEQTALSLHSIVCPHPSIVFNDLLEAEFRYMAVVGVAQSSNSQHSPRSPNLASSAQSVMISSSNPLPPNSTPIELDLNLSLFQQGVRSGAHLHVHRRKRSLMNKLRRSLLPSSSKDKGLAADLNAALAASAAGQDRSALAVPAPQAPSPIYNVQSRFSRSSLSFLQRLVQHIDAVCLSACDLFSKDLSPAFLLAYKSFLDTTSFNVGETDPFMDGGAFGALLRHCMAAMPQKLLEPIQADLCLLADQLPLGTNQSSSSLSSQLSQLISRLPTDEKALLNHLLYLCHEVTSMESVNGYRAEVLASIFLPLLTSIEESSSSNTAPPSPSEGANRNMAVRLTAILAFLIDTPGVCGESPFKKRSKKDRKLRKLSSSSALTHPSPTASSGTGKYVTTSGESDHGSSSPDSSRKSIERGNSMKGVNGSSTLVGTTTIGTAAASQPASAARMDRTSSGSKNASSAGTPISPDSNASSSATDDSTKEGTNGQTPLAAPTSNTFMVADFAWSPTMEGDLELHKGDLLQVLVTDPQGWYVGKLLNVPGNPIGVFPSTYCSTLSKREVSNLLKLEDMSLFESDDASSDDSSSSFSTSSLYQHLVAARMASSSFQATPGTISPTSTPSLFNPAHSLSHTLNSNSNPTLRNFPTAIPYDTVQVSLSSLKSSSSASSDLSSAQSASSSPSSASKGANRAAAPEGVPKAYPVSPASPKHHRSASPSLAKVSCDDPLDYASSALPPHIQRHVLEPASRSFSNSLIQAKSDQISSPTHSEPIVALLPSQPSATILDSTQPTSPNSPAADTSTETTQPPLRPSKSDSTAPDMAPNTTQKGNRDGEHQVTPETTPKLNSEPEASRPGSESSDPLKDSTVSIASTSGKPTTTNHLLNVGLGSESVKPIKYSAAAYAHSKAFPVPPPKGTGASSRSMTQSKHETENSGEPLEGVQSLYTASGRPATVSTFTSNQLETYSTGVRETGDRMSSATSRDSKSTAPGIVHVTGLANSGSKLRTSLPDPILTPLDIMTHTRGPTSELQGGNTTNESLSPSGRPKHLRGPLSSSIQHNSSMGGVSGGVWFGIGAKNAASLQRRLSGPHSPRSDLSPVHAIRHWSPTSSSHVSPREGAIRGGTNVEDLDRKSQEIHSLQGNIFALESFNRHMHNTITEQEMAIERLTRELELLKAAHAMGFGASPAVGGISDSLNGIEGDGELTPAAASDDEGATNTTMDVPATKHNPPVRLRKRPSRRISAVSSSSISSEPTLSSSSYNQIVGSGNSASSGALVSSASVGPLPSASPLVATAQGTPTPTPSTSPSPAPNPTSATSPPPPPPPVLPATPLAIPLTIQIAILVLALSFLLWVLQPHLNQPKP